MTYSLQMRLTVKMAATLIPGKTSGGRPFSAGVFPPTFNARSSLRPQEWPSWLVGVAKW